MVKPLENGITPPALDASATPEKLKRASDNLNIQFDKLIETSFSGSEIAKIEGAIGIINDEFKAISPQDFQQLLKSNYKPLAY